ncbi:TetR/AcrR family transcriptional regulator [Streptomyces sp. NPDC096311]|uniref:TetR/AcrR family transcriptional regulator n=1 Tax=Streptomyces sp. NPDC096311 TaxID=3366083 RepID=UPI0037F3904A
MPPQPHNTTDSDSVSKPATPRRLGRPLHHAPEDERSMLIGAAYRVLANRQSGSIPVGEICAQAGLSTRSFYRHYKSKDELLLAMFEAEGRRVEIELAEVVDLATGPLVALADWLRFCLSLSFDPRRRRRALVMQSAEVTRASGYAAVFEQMQERHRTPLVRILEAGVADGSFRHARPASDAVMIQDVVSCVITRRWNGVEEADADVALASVVDFVSRLIGVRD